MAKKKSVIKKQLLIPVVVALSVLAVAILITMGIILYNTYQDRIVSQNEAESDLIAENVSSFMSKSYALTQEMSQNPSILTMDTAVQSPILAKTVEDNPYLELLYIQGTDGMQTGRSGGKLADRSDRWWFKETKENQKPFISKSYYSVNTGSPCASVFFPMYNSANSFIGVFATDIKLGSLVELVTNHSDDKGDKVVFIVDGEGTVVAHPDATYIEELYNYVNNTKTVSVKDESGNAKTDAEGNISEEVQSIEVSDGFSDMISKVMSGQSGTDVVDVDGGSFYASYTPVVLEGSSDAWSIVALQKRSSIMMPLYYVLAIGIGIAILVIVLAIVFVNKAIRRITDPIAELTDYISVASEGDFSVKANVSDDKSEIGRLANSFNNLSDKISKVLGETMRLLNDVEGSADTLSQLSEETDVVVTDMQSISEGAVSQSEDTAHVVELTEKLDECNTKLVTMSEQLKELTDETRSLSESGIVSVSTLKKKSTDSLDAVDSSYRKVLNLNESSQKIGTIIQEINSISNQTSLLALNASIEAARAGESGKGFAVVAEEVSALAKDSASATENIEGIVRQLQDEIAEIVTEIDMIKKTFEEQIESVDLVEASFARFKDSADSSHEAVEGVSELIEAVDSVNKQVSESIENIHRVSDDTKESAGRISDQMSHHKEDIYNVADKVDKMNTASKLLEEEMSKFTI